MINQRIIESAIGHRIGIDILPGSDGLRISRMDAPVADAIVLDSRGARILSAFLAGAMIMSRKGMPSESLDDTWATVLSVHDVPAPLVRIEQGDRCLDIHSPTWDALRCQIDIISPRLSDVSASPQSRH